jgi:hypothetical protein
LDDGALGACESPGALARSQDARVRRLLDAVIVPALG